MVRRLPLARHGQSKQSRPEPDGGGWWQQDPNWDFPSARKHTGPAPGKDGPGKTVLPGQGCHGGGGGTSVLLLYWAQQLDSSKAPRCRCKVLM